MPSVMIARHFLCAYSRTYVLFGINSRESPPIWYQVEIPIDDTIFHLASEQSPRKRGAN